MRRLVDRVRDDCAALMRREMVGLQTTMQQSWDTGLEGLRRDIGAEHDARDHLAGSLDRLAGALQSLTSALEADRRERLVQIELVECLLREMLVGWAAPLPTPTTVAGPARVVGGSIDTHAVCPPESAIDLRTFDKLPSDAELTVGALVEVRSHFHDRWSNGFRIAEVAHSARGRQFKLTRRSDGSSLPLLFDASDVRRQLDGAPDRQPESDAPIGAPSVD